MKLSMPVLLAFHSENISSVLRFQTVSFLTVLLRICLNLSHEINMLAKATAIFGQSQCHEFEDSSFH